MKELMMIRLGKKGVRALRQNLEKLKLLEVIDDRIPSHGSERKKKQAKNFLEALAEQEWYAYNQPMS